jgi:hypothetical protein
MGFGGGGSGAAVEHTYELLKNYIAPGVESSDTFTPATPLEFDEYAGLAIYFHGKPTAQLALQAILNGSGGTNNFSNGWRSTGSALTNITAGNASQLQLGSNTMIDISRQVAGFFEIYWGDTTGFELFGYSHFSSTGQEAEYMHHLVDGSHTTLSSVQIKTSTSTWNADTRISYYGIKRT